ncbi:MAG: RNA polymerase sigma factor [Paraglaciecola sp.]|uniref:RNA polymerase sigma factor n=1 Tax=Paraglaciecola sp. TaxID=1920173 RepID=UPI0032982332
MDHLATGDIFTKYAGEITAFLTKKLACPDTAADITQELFIRLMKPQQKEAEIENIRAYLYKAASNAAINHYQAEQRRQKLRETSTTDATEQINIHSPEQINADQQRLHVMASALKELSPLAQKIFILARIKGMKQFDIAAKLDVHITTVEKNLSKATRHCYAKVIDYDSPSGIVTTQLSHK